MNINDEQFNKMLEKFKKYAKKAKLPHELEEAAIRDAEKSYAVYPIAVAGSDTFHEISQLIETDGENNPRLDHILQILDKDTFNTHGLSILCQEFNENVNDYDHMEKRETWLKKFNVHVLNHLTAYRDTLAKMLELSNVMSSLDPDSQKYQECFNNAKTLYYELTVKFNALFEKLIKNMELSKGELLRAEQKARLAGADQTESIKSANRVLDQLDEQNRENELKFKRAKNVQAEIDSIKKKLNGAKAVAANATKEKSNDQKKEGEHK